MKHKMSILFYTKGTKTSKDGLVPIYLRITVDGTRVEMSTSKFIELSKWNSMAGKMKGSSEEARSINSYLDILKNKVYGIEKFIVQHDLEYSAATFKNKFLGIEEESRMLIEIFENHNSQMKLLVGKEFAENTYKRYITSLSHTKEFLLHKYKKKDILISKIDLAFINDYDFYLRHKRNCNNNSTSARS